MKAYAFFHGRVPYQSPLCFLRSGEGRANSTPSSGLRPPSPGAHAPGEGTVLVENCSAEQARFLRGSAEKKAELYFFSAEPRKKRACSALHRATSDNTHFPNQLYSVSLKNYIRNFINQRFYIRRFSLPFIHNKISMFFRNPRIPALFPF